jgi:hypothetical protein
MGGEIDQVKRQIEQIGQTLTTLVPKTRIGICTYRDRGDEYVAKGLPLTSSIQDVSDYLSRISGRRRRRLSRGGGRRPVLVHVAEPLSPRSSQSDPRFLAMLLLTRQKLPRCLEIAGRIPETRAAS